MSGMYPGGLPGKHVPDRFIEYGFPILMGVSCLGFGGLSLWAWLSYDTGLPSALFVIGTVLFSCVLLVGIGLILTPFILNAKYPRS